MTSSDPSDTLALRAAFSAFLTGVTIVTTVDGDGAPRGFTANSFTSVSLTPPLILFCISKSSLSLDLFLGTSAFAVNILSDRQQQLSARFAAPVEDRFAEVDWSAGPAGSPVLQGVCGWFDCETRNTVEAGDHHIIIGEVIGYDHNPAEALGYSRGGYFSLAGEVKSSS